MAEPPKFERTNPIKPAQAVTGFSQAMESVGKAAYGQIERMSSDIAQESANKFAQVMGIEAAQKDLKAGKSRNLIPLGQADKLFNQTYQQEQAQELGFQGQQMLQAFMKAASKSPTGDALGEYEQYGKQGIEQLINQAPKSAQSNLRRHLEDTYVTGYNKLSERVEAAGRAYTEANQLKQANQLDSNITNRTLEDGKDAGLEALKRKLEFIEASENRYIATGGTEGYDPNTAAIARKQATERWQAAAHQAEWQVAHNEGKGSEYLQQLRESPPKGLEPSQQDALIKSVLGYVGEYQAALSAQQTIDYIKYATMVDTGKMTEAALLQARKDISEKQLAELEHRIAVRAFKMKDETDLYNTYKDQFGNSVAMSSAKPDQLDKIFEKHVQVVMAQREAETGEPQTATLADRAQLARPIQATIPIINKQVSAAVKSENPEVAVMGANILEALKGNQFAMAGVSANDRALAKGITNRIARGSPPEQAVAFARERVAGLTEKGIDENKRIFQTLLKGAGSGSQKDLSNVVNQEAFVAKQMGQDGKLPPGMATDFMSAAQDYFLLDSEDLDKSFAYAKEEIRRTYNPYLGNSPDEKPEEMYLAPSVLTNLNPIEVQNALANSLSELFTKQFEDKRLASRYEFDPARILPPSVASMQSSRILSEARRLQENGGRVGGERPSTYVGAIPGRRIDKDGRVTEGHFKIVSDDNTRKPLPNEAASYGIQFVPKGKTNAMPIQDPRANYAYARFVISKDILEKHSVELRAEQDKQRELYEIRESVEQDTRALEGMMGYVGF